MTIFQCSVWCRRSEFIPHLDFTSEYALTWITAAPAPYFDLTLTLLWPYFGVGVDDVEQAQQWHDRDEQKDETGLLGAWHRLQGAHVLAIPDAGQMLLAVGVGYKLQTRIHHMEIMYLGCILNVEWWNNLFSWWNKLTITFLIMVNMYMKTIDQQIA